MRGVSDLCNPLTGLTHKGVYLEIKKPEKRAIDGTKIRSGALTKEQKEFLARMSADGWRTETVTDWVEGVRILFDHFGIPYPCVLQNAILYAPRS